MISIVAEGDQRPEFYFFLPRTKEEGGANSILEDVHKILGEIDGKIPKWAFDLQLTYFE